MATLDYQIDDTNDDVCWDDAGFYNIDFEYFGSFPGPYGLQYNAFRFPGVTIPAGALITSAYLSFYRSNTVGSPGNCTIYAEDAANPTQITSKLDGQSRVKTTTSITLIPATSGTWFNSDSIVSIIQELISSYSYTSGAAMIFLIDSSGTESNYSEIYDVSKNASYAAKLHIEYKQSWGGTWGG